MNIPHPTPIKLTFMHLYCNLLIKKILFLKLTKIPAIHIITSQRYIFYSPRVREYKSFKN